MGIKLHLRVGRSKHKNKEQNIYTKYLDIYVVFLYYVVQLGNIKLLDNNEK